jgi:hypothetical protein
MRRGVVAGLLLASVAVAACASGRREAASLVEAVDRYRRAEMNAKGPLADAIDAVPCSDGEVCAAKAACVAAARPTVRGAALKREVESSLAELRVGRLTQGQANAERLPEKLDEASRLLDEGRVKLPVCDAQITALRLKYAL